MVSVQDMARAVLACVLVISGAVLAPASATATPSIATVPHRVRTNGQTFFDSVTNQEFLPRGANYIRLAGPANAPWHSTFEPGMYSPAGADTMLHFLKVSSGYNTVRVFVDSGGVGLGHGIGANPLGAHGLRIAYLDNLADFIRRAAAYGIYVMLSVDSVPFNPYFQAITDTVNNGNAYEDATGHNRLYLDHGWVVAKQAYMQNVAGLLALRLGDLRSAILAYATDNEVFFRTNEKPFSQGSGVYRLRHTGGTYDMAVPAHRQKLLEDALVHYANAAIRGVTTEADPQALVTVGFGTNFAVGKTGHYGLPVRCEPQPGRACNPSPVYQYWYPGDPANLARWSGVHFVDVHIYPRGGGYSLAGDLGSSGIGFIAKPYMLGELGAMKTAYPSIYAAAEDLRVKQIGSCAIGNGAKGWLFWTYDSDLAQPGLGQQGLFYSLLSPDGSGTVNGALAPVARPHPCA